MVAHSAPLTQRCDVKYDVTKPVCQKTYLRVSHLGSRDAIAAVADEGRESQAQSRQIRHNRTT